MAKRKNSSKTIWILGILVALAALLYWGSGSKQHSAQPPVAKTQEKYVLEKTGAGATADFTAASWRIHSLVDEAVTAGKMRIQSQQEQKRDVPRQGIDGSIRWHVRQTLLILPDGISLEKFREVLQRTLLGSGEIFSVTADQYQGQSVTRFDIGLQDKLEGDPVTIITDRLYVAKDKKSADSRPPGKERGKLAIIIDDFGYTSEPIAAFAAIDRPLTFAVLPYHPYTKEAASRGLAAGHQIMLHLPMEPLSAAEHQENTSIITGMSEQDIQQTVSRALAEVPGVIGVNNHQGSKATADKRVMRSMLSVVKAKQLFFVDSRTTTHSVGAETARELGIRTAANELFLDNSNEIEHIKQQIRTSARIAIKDGAALVIGHARPNTAIALRELIPELEADGVRLVFASQLVK